MLSGPQPTVGDWFGAAKCAVKSSASGATDILHEALHLKNGAKWQSQAKSNHSQYTVRFDRSVDPNCRAVPHDAGQISTKRVKQEDERFEFKWVNKPGRAK